MSPRFILGRENVSCVAEVVNRSLKADCTDFSICKMEVTVSLTNFPKSKTTIATTNLRVSGTSAQLICNLLSAQKVFQLIWQLKKFLRVCMLSRTSLEICS